MESWFRETYADCRVASYALRVREDVNHVAEFITLSGSLGLLLIWDDKSRLPECFCRQAISQLGHVADEREDPTMKTIVEKLEQRAGKYFGKRYQRGAA